MQKSITISKELETIIQWALDIIADEKSNNPNNSNLENLLKFRYIFLFYIKCIKIVTNIKNLYFRN